MAEKYGMLPPRNHPEFAGGLLAPVEESVMDNAVWISVVGGDFAVWDFMIIALERGGNNVEQRHGAFEDSAWD